MNKLDIYTYDIITEDIVKMDKIIHLDEMSTDDFINFVKSFVNIQNRDVEISEKVDGMNFSFGLDENDKFYSKTKSSKPVTDPSVYGDFSFLQGIKDYHNILKSNSRILKTVKDMVGGFEKTDSFTLQIFGELLPSSQTNIVKYDKGKIGNGAIVLFDVKVDGKSILDKPYSKRVFNSLASQLNDKGGWKVYEKPLLNPKNFTFDVYHLITLEDLYRKYFDILNSRKRADKSTKEKAKRVIQALMDSIKRQFMKNMIMNRQSVLGNVEPEGLILRDFSNNLLVKLVDKDAFTTANQAGSQYIKDVQVAVRKINTNIKNDVFGNADIMKNFAKVIEKSVDWAFTQKQSDPNFKVKSLDDVLKVAYNDMVEEKRIKYTAPQAISKTVGYLKDLRKEIVKSMKELESGKDDIPESKYIISKEKMESYLDSTDTTISDLQSLPKGDGIKVYLTIIAFVFGPYKIRELKKQFNLTEGLTKKKLGTIIVK